MNNLIQYPESPNYVSINIDQGPQRTNSTIYNNDSEFIVENYGLIKMFFLIFDVTPALASSFPIPTSPFLIDNVFLLSGGNVIGRMTTTYAVARMESSPADLYSLMLNGTTIQGTFNALKTVSLPLFFYAIDGQLLDPTKYKNLSIRCITKANKEQMGLSQELTALSVKLRTNFLQSKTYVPVALTNSYNITQNAPIALLSGTIAKTVKINVPYRILNIFFMIRLTANQKTIGVINNIKLNFTNGQSILYDISTDYGINSNGYVNPGGVFPIKFGLRLQQDLDFYMKANGNMNPIGAEISYTITGDSVLYMCVEHESEIVDNDGLLWVQTSQSFK